jgi:hypothetical protein
MTAAPPRDRRLRSYVRAVETRFCRHRGTPRIVSPREFSLMLEWFERGIPVSVVVRALDEAFASAGPDGIGSLSYLRAPVDRSFRRYREARLGEAEPGGPVVAITLEEAREMLGLARDRIRRAAGQDERGADDMASVARGLERHLLRLASGPAGAPLPDLASLERSLLRLDGKLLKAAVRRLGPEEIARLREEAERELAPHRELMAPAIFSRTVERHFRRLLRRATDLPELSLFARPSPTASP